MLMPVKRPDDVGGWRIGAFFTSFFAMFILEFGDKSQFIVAAVAMRTGDPVLSAVGGSLGILLALAPAVLLRQQFFLQAPQIGRASGRERGCQNVCNPVGAAAI